MGTMTLNEVSKLTEDEARATLESIMWRDGPVCPHCGSVGNATKLEGKKHRVGVFQCGDCRGQFSVTVGTILEQSHLPIRTWLMAFAIMCSSKKGVSALQLQRQLGLGSYRSAWHMAHRIRHAMSQEPLAGMLSGIIEADETYVGGKPRHGTGVHKRGRGTKKAPVMALVERGGEARAFTVPIGKDAQVRNSRECPFSLCHHDGRQRRISRCRYSKAATISSII
jgi:transposase-like protein